MSNPPGAKSTILSCSSSRVMSRMQRTLYYPLHHDHRLSGPLTVGSRRPFFFPPLFPFLDFFFDGPSPTSPSSADSSSAWPSVCCSSAAESSAGRFWPFPLRAALALSLASSSFNLVLISLSSAWNYISHDMESRGREVYAPGLLLRSGWLPVCPQFGCARQVALLAP